MEKINKSLLNKYLDICNADFISNPMKLVCSILKGSNSNQCDFYKLEYTTQEALNGIESIGKLTQDDLDLIAKFGISFTSLESTIDSVTRSLLFICPKAIALSSESCCSYFSDFLNDNFDNPDMLGNVFYFYIPDFSFDDTDSYSVADDLDVCFTNIYNAIITMSPDIDINKFKLINCCTIPDVVNNSRNLTDRWNNFKEYYEKKNYKVVNCHNLVNTYFDKIKNYKESSDICAVYQEFLDELKLKYDNSVKESKLKANEEGLKPKASLLAYRPDDEDSSDADLRISSFKSKFFYFSCMYLGNVEFEPVFSKPNYILNEYINLCNYNRLQKDLAETTLNLPLLFGYQVSDTFCMYYCPRKPRSLFYSLRGFDVSSKEKKLKNISIYVNKDNLDCIDNTTSLYPNLLSMDKSEAIESDMKLKEDLLTLMELIGCKEYLTVFNTILYKSEGKTYLCYIDEYKSEFDCKTIAPYSGQTYWIDCKVDINIPLVYSLTYFKEFCLGAFNPFIISLLKKLDKENKEEAGFLVKELSNTKNPYSVDNKSFKFDFNLSLREFLFRVINACSIYKDVKLLERYFSYYLYGTCSVDSKNFLNEYIPVLMENLNLNVFRSSSLFSSLGGYNPLVSNNLINIDGTMI